MCKERKYIWLDNQRDDCYAEFQDTFCYEREQVVLRITADYQFAAYVNGAFAANSQYADLPEYKTVSTYDITQLCRPGKNVLTVKAYHPGQEWSQSRKMTACVSYQVENRGTVLAVSSEETLCREDASYTVGDMLTFQLGMGYNYDFTAQAKPWVRAAVVDSGFTEAEKPILNTVLTDFTAVPLEKGGICLAGGETSGEIMLRAKLSGGKAEAFPVTAQAQGGVYLLCDLLDERAGYPWFSVACEENATAYLGWGEHLADGRVRTAIDSRSFAAKIQLKAGKNDFSDYLRRIGCRYLCLYVCTDKPVTFYEMGLQEERYPFSKPAKDFGDSLLNRLYETGRRTLELCAHQHYEDCPWREQALYGMDSRNQMLFGYGAFGEYAFPRANLRLMAKCIEEDGLLPLCPPSRNTITIVSFSAYWVIAVYENAKADYNEAFVKEMLPYVRRVLDAFYSRMHDGVMHTFSQCRYWNFHEWSEGLDGGEIFRDHEIDSLPDACLTAICCRAADAGAALADMAGEKALAAQYRAYADALASGMEQFYVPEKGLFASYIRQGVPTGFHEMTHSLLLSTGRLQGIYREAAIKALSTDCGLIPVTLSGLVLKYEGLLQYADAKAYVLEDMKKTFVPMLEQGATTYWETALGEKDFENAGSLCHGWSAVPCYVLDSI